MCGGAEAPNTFHTWTCSICGGVIGIAKQPQSEGFAACPACVSLAEEFMVGMGMAYGTILQWRLGITGETSGSSERYKIISELERLDIVPKGLLYRLLGRTDQPEWGTPKQAIAGSQSEMLANNYLTIEHNSDTVPDSNDEEVLLWLAKKAQLES